MGHNVVEIHLNSVYMIVLVKLHFPGCTIANINCIN